MQGKAVTPNLYSLPPQRGRGVVRDCSDPGRRENMSAGAASLAMVSLLLTKN